MRPWELQGREEEEGEGRAMVVGEVDASSVLHASKCKDADCRVVPHCAAIKEVFLHLKHCSYPSIGCSSSCQAVRRALIEHAVSCSGQQGKGGYCCPVPDCAKLKDLIRDHVDEGFLSKQQAWRRLPCHPAAAAGRPQPPPECKDGEGRRACWGSHEEQKRDKAACLLDADAEGAPRAWGVADAEPRRGEGGRLPLGREEEETKRPLGGSEGPSPKKKQQAEGEAVLGEGCSCATSRDHHTATRGAGGGGQEEEERPPQAGGGERPNERQEGQRPAGAGVCVDDGEEEEEEDLESFLQHDVPEDLLCPVSLALLTDPVVASDGITYQRDCLLQCIDWARRRGGDKALRSPMTGLAMAPLYLPNVTVRRQALDFREARTKQWQERRRRSRQQQPEAHSSNHHGTRTTTTTTMANKQEATAAATPEPAATEPTAPTSALCKMSLSSSSPSSSSPAPASRRSCAGTRQEEDDEAVACGPPPFHGAPFGVRAGARVYSSVHTITDAGL